MKKMKAMYAAWKTKREEKRRQRHEETSRLNHEAAELQIELSGYVSF